MMYQANVGADLSAIYDPYIGAPAVEGMIQKRVPATAAEATQAVNDAEAALGYCRDEVLPELDRLDLNVTRPLLELLEIGKSIDKTIVKRSHKLIDYDRHRLTLAKLNGKQERSFSDEKQIFKVSYKTQLAVYILTLC
jgi:amphiphysin